MPANRSRTDRWRESLDQVYERNGGLEISIDRGEALCELANPSPHLSATTPRLERNAQPSDLIWRVRILGLNDDEIVVEQPGALGQSICLDVGTKLIVGLTIGQNRWMFKTDVVGLAQIGQAHGRPIAGLRLAMPVHVERCQRRNFYRMSTAQLHLPEVQCWSLLDLTSVVAAEVANRALITGLLSGAIKPLNSNSDEPLVLPDVGPPFKAHMVNIGGGGAGLLVDRGETIGPDKSRALWLRLDLRPHIPAPIAMTAKVAHTHMDSGQNVYLGVAFDFSFHAAHRDFVAGRICDYVLANQREQVRRIAG